MRIAILAFTILSTLTAGALVTLASNAVASADRSLPPDEEPVDMPDELAAALDGDEFPGCKTSTFPGGCAIECSSGFIGICHTYKNGPNAEHSGGFSCRTNGGDHNGYGDPCGW